MLLSTILSHSFYYRQERRR